MKHATKKILIFNIVFFIFLPLAHSKDNEKKQYQKFSINTGSFLRHFEKSKDVKYTENFNNHYLSAGINLTKSVQIVAGTFKNSYNNRCAILGVEKKWYEFDSNLSFDGFYSYAGEFFFSAFSNCQNDGIYKNFRRATSIGFAPYIYHGLEYKIAKNLSIRSGIIVPTLFVATIRWYF